VPALEVDGLKLQNSLAISRQLELLRPDPPLFPADPDHRRAVEEAERWGEAEAQPVSRRIFRCAVVEQTPLRRWVASQTVGEALAGPMATLVQPLTRAMAGLADASIDAARADIAALPALFDRIDGLIADGTIGGDQPNAADFQLLASVSSIGLMVDLQPALEGRPCQQAARRLFPDYDGLPTPPNSLPANWLTPLH
jgi:glutathione S-transferase